MVTLRLFGSPSLDAPDGPDLRAAMQQRRLALLALLAAQPQSGLRRDKLLGYLWPEADLQRARHLLSQAVYALRRALGRQLIESRGSGTLRLNQGCIRVDLWDFLDALEQNEPERAIHVYRGPLLDGFFLPAAPEFERWVEDERARLARLHAGALERLAERCETVRDVRGAVVWWRRLVEHDRCSSRIALRLMRALAAAGDAGGALRHAEIHAAFLRSELGVEPDPEVGAYASQLQGGEPDPAASERLRSIPDTWPPITATTSLADGRTNWETVPELPEVEAVLPVSSAPPSKRRWAAVAFLPLIAAAVVYVVRPWAEPVTGATLPIRSIAVLPLENCTPDSRQPNRPDPEQEYFADGLTDALITDLAKIPGLRVISRTSAMQYKGRCGSRDVRSKSLSDIARELDVDAVLEGTVVRDRERVRVTAQLIRAATEEHLWADGLEYEREVRDVLALQRDIVVAIAGSILAETRLTQVSTRAAERRTEPGAYVLYLKGRYLWNEHRVASYREALDHFQRAAAIDSTFALAYAGMADVYVHLDDQEGHPEKDAREQGFEAARRALRLDDGLSEAHASLAHLLMHVEDWTAAERAYQRAIQINSNNGNARILYAFYLSALERHDEAIRQAVRALEVDPLSSRTHYFAGYTLYFARRYDEAITQWQGLLELNPAQADAHFRIALAHLNRGRQGEGLAWARRGLALAGDDPGAQVVLAHCLALAGQNEEARRLLATVTQRKDISQVDPLSLAHAFSVVGDRDAAFHWLDQAVERDHGWLMFLRVESAYDLLRDDPRFTALLRTMRWNH